MSGFIDDGYTLDALIPEVDGAPAFQITYRPMLRGERQRLAIGTMSASDSGDNERMIEWETRTVESVAKLIKSWTLKDRAGKAVKISADALRRLDGQFQPLFEFVAGYSKPKEPDADSEESADAKNS